MDLLARLAPRRADIDNEPTMASVESLRGVADERGDVHGTGRRVDQLDAAHRRRRRLCVAGRDHERDDRDTPHAAILPRDHMHAPAMHTWPTAHRWLHAPQFVASLS